jgi:energy-coupling factor transporter ATP-binding protein EcfA2
VDRQAVTQAASSPPPRVAGRAAPPSPIAPAEPAARVAPVVVRPQTIRTDLQSAVLAATERLRGELATMAFPFEVEGASHLRQERTWLLGRLDAYVLPRLRRMDAPLVVVVGGSTGAGKSTLTNSLVGAVVSPVGVIRPTTRSPVLVHHPQDAGAFLSRRILPGLERRSMSGSHSLEAQQAPEGAGSIRLVPHDAMVPGLAVIDSPDLDSLVESNRTLAQELFGVADLWLLVTTGTDYADAASWELLLEAADRQVSVAVVLDRMRPSEVETVRMHFATMLRDRGLASAPVFVIAETELEEGLLPRRTIASLHRWLGQQGSDVGMRGGHIGRAVAGALDQVRRRALPLADAVAAQVNAGRALRDDVDACVATAQDEIWRAIEGGALLDAAVEEAWQRVTDGSADGSNVARLTRRVATALRGGDPGYDRIGQALVRSGTALVALHASRAVGHLAQQWGSGLPGPQAELLPELQRLPDDFTDRADLALRAWLRGLASSVHHSGDPRPGAGHTPPVAAALGTLAFAGPAAGQGEAPGGARAASLLVMTAAAREADLSGQVRAARETLRRTMEDLLLTRYARMGAVLDEVSATSDGAAPLRAAVEQVRAALAAIDGAGTLPADEPAGA